MRGNRQRTRGFPPVRERHTEDVLPYADSLLVHDGSLRMPAEAFTPTESTCSLQTYASHLYHHSGTPCAPSDAIVELFERVIYAASDTGPASGGNPPRRSARMKHKQDETCTPRQ